MKKLAIGCGIVVLVLGVVAAGVAYWGYLKIRSAATQFAELRHIPEMDAQIQVKTPYFAPKSGELTQAQVDKFMQIQTKVRQRLGENGARMQRTYQSLADRANRNQTNVTDLPQLISAYRDLAAAWMDAKRAQIDALNSAGMSLDEYRWVRSECYRALDIPFIDLDVSRLAQQVKDGKDVSNFALVGGALTGKGPAANTKLVEKFRKQLEDNMPLAAFGL